MITLPPHTRPSELLFLEGLSSFVKELLKASRSLQQEGKWGEAERSVCRALERSQASGAQVSRGAALVHLVDIYLATARTGKALRDARRAHRLFAAQPSRFQRHNEAVAAYAVGLVHQVLGDNIEALQWYEGSIELLDVVTLDWGAENAVSRVRCCKRTRHWIETLVDCLTDIEMAAATTSHTNLLLPFIDSGSGSVFSLASLRIEGYVVAGTIELAGQIFQVELLGGSAHPSFPAEADCYALPIPARALQLLDASDGDYAIVVRQHDADREGPGVLETLSGVEFGNFKRDASGRISFFRPNATVIGSEAIGEEFPVGYVKALLKRT